MDINWEKREVSIQVLPEVRKINVDEKQIQKVIKSLVLNAAQSMTTEGKITIKAGKIRDNDDQKDWVELIIEDNGNGMKPEMLEEVFEPFYTTKTRGIGLGLTISKKIVEKHGGKMTIYSQKEKGTKVILCLPFHEKAAVKEQTVGENQKTVNR